ncbi:hypothetical protein AAG570_002701 [Ranatra chinensis]|uniref:Peptidase S1 domain-containing protein n=1 Tax=Ranatra chinensis TaxID=642074 RepID=A0ABD0Y8E6_9HEMI
MFRRLKHFLCQNIHGSSVTTGPINVCRLFQVNDSGSTPFELNRESILEWIGSLLSGGGGGGGGTPEPPKPIDPLSCTPCIGGQETDVNEYPWMLLLTYDGKFYCGGTLVTPLYAVTAAHCVKGFRASKIKVRFLEHNQNIDTESETFERQLESAMPHPNYNTNTLDNDIAILKFDKPVEFNKRLRPACLPPPKKSFAGDDGIVTGWGVTKPSKLRSAAARASPSPTLQELVVPIMTNEECQNTGYMKSQITDNMMCAGYKEGGKDSCQVCHQCLPHTWSSA